MTTATAKPIGTFEAGGEKFVVLKKVHLDELLTLFRSVAVGERLLRQGRTRTFDQFLRGRK